MIIMEPFVYLADFPFIICKLSKIACVANEISTHLLLFLVVFFFCLCYTIVQAIDTIPGIIRDQSGLRRFQFPPPTIDPIPFIAPPEEDGLRCNECGYVTRTVQWIQRHCREEHGWQNPWKKGGNVKSRSKQARVLPWTTGVRCQRFFRSRAGYRWFEVGGASEVLRRPEAVEAAEDVVARIKRIHQEQTAKFEAAGKELIRVADEKKEPNAWVERTGWAQHLRGLDPDRLRAAAGSVGADETVLQLMCASFERVMNRARAAAVGRRVGLSALSEVERKDMHIKPSRPFDNRLEDDTWVRYKGVWQTLLRIWQRTQTWPDEERPPYRLTTKQDNLWDDFEEAAERDVQEMGETGPGGGRGRGGRGGAGGGGGRPRGESRDD